MLVDFFDFRYEARSRLLEEQYEELIRNVNCLPCSNWSNIGGESSIQQLRSAVDAVLGVEPEFYPNYSRHLRRELEGPPSNFYSLLISLYY